MADDIRQLIISPEENFLAILTTHTVHIALLPESSHLTAVEKGPLKLKTYMLGPTTHVTSQASISSALWHPLGVNGTCLVTVTEDAVVRVWELSVTARSTFERATLAIDLKKLADGTSVDQDFGASVSQTNKGFSPDAFDMEVASACFSDRESGLWSPMTLWVAMRGGDLYALCPLLPEKWSPPATLIPELSVSIVSKNAAVEDDPEVSKKAKQLARQQQEWMSELDNQEPTIITSDTGAQYPVEVYTRPNRPGRVPKLQGPFEFEQAPEESDNDLDSLISDIYTIGAKASSDDLMRGEDDDSEAGDLDQAGLSLSVICLLASSGRLSIYLDLDGVEAQWLPKSKSKLKMSRFMDDDDEEYPTLLTFEVLETARPQESTALSWPMFSQDVNSSYSFYITDSTSITYISLDWVFRLEQELSGSAPGTDFRIDLLVRGQSSVRQRVYPKKSHNKVTSLAASTLILDPDLGYFLLTASPHGPIAITFESPETSLELDYRRSISPAYDSYEPDIKPEILYEARPVYEPSPTFKANRKIDALREKLRASQYQRILPNEVRLSPATLTVMNEVHKVLSEETHQLGSAAAELFRRCEKLQIELMEQIKKANDLAKRVEVVIGDDYNEEGKFERKEEEIERRIEEARKRQESIVERLEKVRKRVAKGAGRELSDKEKAWVEELESMQTNILPSREDRDEDKNANDGKPWQRLEAVKNLADELLEQVQDLQLEQAADGDGGGGEGQKGKDVRVPKQVRDQKMAEVWKAVDRETAMVEATKSRLERLGLS